MNDVNSSDVLNLLRKYDYELVEEGGTTRIIELHGEFVTPASDLDNALQAALSHFLLYTLGTWFADVWDVLKKYGETERLFPHHDDIEKAIQYARHYHNMFYKAQGLSDDDNAYTTHNELPF